MEAAVEVHRQNDSLLDIDAIKHALTEAGVTDGIDENACKELVDIVNNLPVSGRARLQVARAAPPIDGENGRFEMVVEYHRDRVGLLREFGRIDFHERGAFTPIEKGQLIAKNFLPTPGVAGKTVLGQEIKPKPGDPAKFTAGQGTKLEANKTELRATRAGDLQCIDDLIEVLDKIRVAGDLDFTVGSIECEGQVRIEGDVLPGFHVHARGDVFVSGVVDSAEINSQGTVVIAQSVLRGSRISAKQSIAVGSVRDAYLESAGNIKILTEAINSTVIANDSIVIPKAGRVIGGRLWAKNQIEVGTAGHEKGILTVLAAGLNPHEELQAAKLQAKIGWASQVEAQAIKLKEVAASEQHPQLDELASRQATKREQDEEELNELKQKKVEYENCRIKVSPDLHSGVRIRIGPAELATGDEQQPATFYYDNESGQVVEVNPKGDK